MILVTIRWNQQTEKSTKFISVERKFKNIYTLELPTGKNEFVRKKTLFNNN